MPELPEIATICKALQAKLPGRVVTRVIQRRADLRRRIPENLAAVMTQARVVAVWRRSKYILIDVDPSHPTPLQTVIIHLGMSGRLFFSDPHLPYDKHDHVIFDFDDGKQLRLRDPRRFGLIDLCTSTNLAAHALFADLGIEPLGEAFTAEALYQLSRGSVAPIKSFLMNAQKIVGIGNIYACEALFAAQILPTRRARTLSRPEALCLQVAIQKVLLASIAAGGTSFRDYVDADSKPGLHAIDLAVYGREGENCKKCRAVVKRIVQAGRSTFYCRQCQK